MEGTGITSLARLQLPPFSRLYRPSCCPDKDLIVIFSRLGGKDRMSLWKMQGSRKWEVDVDAKLTTKEEVVGLAWSPDCQTIVLIHDPPRISCHSIQDGREERSISLTNDFSEGSHLRDVWWFSEEWRPIPNAIPDIFKRRDILTGSAHSLLKMLPFLDALKDDSQTSGRGAQPKPPAPDNMPSYIKNWPVLPADPWTASIQLTKRPEDALAEDLDDNEDDVNKNSILAVADSSGHIQCFLDGSYPLGAVFIDASTTAASLHKRSGEPVLLAFQDLPSSGHRLTSVLPVEVNLTLLRTRVPRDVARASSTAWQLLWYTIRLFSDLREVWMGSGNQIGARDPGLKWLTRLSDLQPEELLSDATTWAKLDLIQLLVTERSTDAVSDFIGSGEQMTERGLLKWETTVTSALSRLRDQSQQHIAPACQRLHLILEEILAWSQLSSHELCQFNRTEIQECLAMTRQAIFAASWLSTVARRELSRFKEFMKWLRYEINNAVAVADHVLQPHHDILEVQSYITYSLSGSPIDGWFTGNMPTNLSPPAMTSSGSLAEAMARARMALHSPAEISLQRPVAHHNIPPDRNLHALLHSLAQKCSTEFLRASLATARSALCTRPPARQQGHTRGDIVVREWMAGSPNKHGITQYLAAYLPRTGDLCVFRLKYSQESGISPVLAYAVLDCALPRDGVSMDKVQLLCVEFFDDDCFIVVGCLQDAERHTVVALVEYSSLAFEMIYESMSLAELSREEVAWETFERRRTGKVTASSMKVKRSYVLEVCKSENISLSVNGRPGRRVACVLDLEESILEVLDMEPDDEEGRQEDEE